MKCLYTFGIHRTFQATMSGRSLLHPLDGVGVLGALNLVQLVHMVLETPKVAHVHLDFSDDAEVIAPLQENVDRQVSVPAAVSSLIFSLRESFGPPRRRCQPQYTVCAMTVK